MRSPCLPQRRIILSGAPTRNQGQPRAGWPASLTKGWTTPTQLPPDQCFLCQEHQNQRRTVLFPTEAAGRGNSGPAHKVCAALTPPASLQVVWEAGKESKRPNSVSAGRGPVVTGLGCTLPHTLPCLSQPHLQLPSHSHYSTWEKHKSTFLYQVPTSVGGGHSGGKGPIIQLTIRESEGLNKPSTAVSAR